MSVGAVATSASVCITECTSTSTVLRATVYTSAAHLLRYYCICHTYCTECCASAVLLTV